METTNTNRARQYGEALQRLFPATLAYTPESLFRRLRRLECRISRMNERDCSVSPRNDAQAEDWAREYEDACERVKSLLWGKAATHSPDGVPRIRFNGDPRGYALKIDDAWMHENRDAARGIKRDWGGYGLLAPDLNP